MWVFQGKIVVPWSPAWFSYCFPCSIAESCPCPKALHCPFLRPPGSCWSRSYVRALWMVCLLPWALALPNRMNSKFEVIPAAMSDGAKRRLTSDGEFDEKLPVPRRPRPAFLMELLQRQRGARLWSSPEGTQGPDELCRAGQVFRSGSCGSAHGWSHRRTGPIWLLPSLTSWVTWWGSSSKVYFAGSTTVRKPDSYPSIREMSRQDWHFKNFRI